jgi:hypothetical protein
MRTFVSGMTLCLVLLALLAVWSTRGFPVPAPVEADAPPHVFSAERALERLAHLLGDESPHPVGSPANAAVRDRIVAQLEALGFEPEIQRGTGCHERMICARVENVLAEIPGRGDGAILLMAHYDSVPVAPGAGDNGAAVAVLLEVAGMLRAQAPFENAIRFLFTDGEEMGLLGARVFFDTHRWAQQPMVVLNFEGSGSGGPVYLLRTARDSGHLVRTYLEAASYPVAHSIAQAIFELMPNDTDFSIAMRAGHVGIDFAFAGDRHTYHTPLDNLANLDPGTVQHHGANAIELTRALADRDLRERSPNFVFHSLHFGAWVRWPAAASVPLALLAFVLLAVAGVRTRAEASALRVAASVIITIGVLVAAVVVSGIALWLVDVIAGARPLWPVNPWPWRLALWGAPLVVLSIAGIVGLWRYGFWPLALGVWLFWAVLALLVGWRLPQASALVLPAVLVAAVALFALALSPQRHRRIAQQAAAIVPALCAGLFLWPLTWAAEETQSLLAALPAMGAPLALLATALLPLLVAEDAPRARGSVPALCAGGAALLAGLVLAPFAVLYSPEKPQLLTFRYVQDLDKRDAYLAVLTVEPVPARVQALLALDSGAGMRLPGEDREFPAAAAPFLESGGAPEIEIIERVVDGDTQRVAFTLRGTPAAGALALIVPADSALTTVWIDGQTLIQRRRREGADYRMDFYAPPPDGVPMALTFASLEPHEITIAELRHRWPPELEHALEARGPLGVPVQLGDHWIVLRSQRLE